MTKKEIYWDVLFVAEGIATLMTKEEVMYSAENDSLSADIPAGLCCLFSIMHISRNFLPERPGLGYKIYWFPPGDWKARAEFMKEELRKLYKK